LKIEIDMDAICVRCGRKGATTSLTYPDGERVELPEPICLDCAIDHMKKNPK